MAAGDEYARLGSRVGQFYVGDVAEPTTNSTPTGTFTCYIAGTDRTRAFGDLREIRLVQKLGEPMTLTVSGLRGFTPTRGQEIKLYHGGNDVGWAVFAGHILEVTQSQTRMADDARFTIRCQDYTWLMDRYARVTKTYYSAGVNVVLNDILDTFTDGGFSVGYCDAALGDVDRIQFTGEIVSTAIDRLAKTVGAFYQVTADKHVHIFTDPDHLPANGIVLNDSVFTYDDYRSTLDLTSVRTRVVYVGAKTTASAVASAGATSVSVDDCSIFDSGGGSAIHGADVFAYTGLSVTSGAGNLTGVTGLADDLGQGDEVAVYVQEDDVTAQTNLATILGGVASGIATHWVNDGRLSQSEASTRAQADLTKYGGALQTITYVTRDRFHYNGFWTMPGKTATVTITTPIAVSDVFRIQAVEWSVDSDLTTATPGWRRRVTLGAINRQLELVDRLALIQGAS